MLTSNSILLYFVRMLIKSISGIRGTIGGVPEKLSRHLML